MSPKYKRLVIVLGLIAIFLIIMLYFYQEPFVAFWVTYLWYPFKYFILGKFGWIVYGVIAPIILITGGVLAYRKWMK